VKKSILVLVAVSFVALLSQAWQKSPVSPVYAIENKEQSFIQDKSIKDYSKENRILSAIFSIIAQNHFKPVEINDEFSKKAFKVFLENVDNFKRFYLLSDVSTLRNFDADLDNQLLEGRLDTYELAWSIMKTRIEEAEKINTALLSEKIDLDIVESIELDPDKLDFPKDEAERLDRWRKFIKYQIMSKIEELDAMQKKTAEKTDTVRILSMAALETEAREKIKKRNGDWFRRLHKRKDTENFQVYVNSLLAVIDPHTEYFPPADKENFDISISGQFEGIGARLQERDGFITITEIIPGSPAARQGELKPDDVIIKVAQGAAEPVDVTDMPLDDAVKMIRGPKGTEVRLTIKTMEGVYKIISLIRDVIVMEESYAKSVTLKQTDGTLVGLIDLPKFYTDYNNKGGRTCSTDVKKELEKMNAQGIRKVIIDLRGNGGGSLQDVVDMVGLFIPLGPIVQVKSRTGEPYLLTDKDPKVVYDGEVLVLVDSYSASASEIFAAAIQDYGRGIIIGSNSTFGKGTVQKFHELNQVGNHLNPNASDEELGSLKLTTQKFYRVNGDATQLKGVVPDIILPDNYAYLEVGEKKQDYPLAFSEIRPTTYVKWNGVIEKMESLREQCFVRVSNNEFFRMVDEKAKKFKENKDNSTEPLNYVKYLSEKEKQQKDADTFEDLLKNLVPMEISPLDADSIRFQEKEKMEMFKKWEERLNKDIYVREALKILLDI